MPELHGMTMTTRGPRHTRAASPGSSANAVDIVLCKLRRVVVDDVFHSGQVTARVLDNHIANV